MSKTIRPKVCSACLMLVFGASPAFAYVGPGAGLSAIGSILAFFGVIFLMILGFLWYPIKRLISRKKVTENLEAGETQDPE